MCMSPFAYRVFRGWLFDRRLSLFISNPHTKFEVIRSKYYRLSQVMSWQPFETVLPGDSTWCQFSKETFLCPEVIHTSNLKFIGQSIVKLLHRNKFCDAFSLTPHKNHMFRQTTISGGGHVLEIKTTFLNSIIIYYG